MLRLSKYIGAIVLSLIIHLFFYGTETLKKIDYLFYDCSTTFFSDRQDKESGSYTVIVDIDEKSLQTLGQWPWARVLDAQLINSIKKMNPSALGINILFPEQDRVSPLSIQQFYAHFFDVDVNLSSIPPPLRDNDKLFAQSIKTSHAILSTYFGNEDYSAKHCEKLNYKNNIFSDINTSYTASSLLCNHSVLQKEVEDFGFINARIDNDGIFRRIPLFMRYHDKVFPSFALATLLSIDKYIKIPKNSSDYLINFSTKKPKTFSAIDVLNGEVNKDELQGKIVILGSSVVGLNPNYTIYNGEKISNSLIHATVINNLLDNKLLTQPKIYKQINLFSSFLLSLLLTFLLFKRLYFYTLLLLFSSLFISFLGLTEMYKQGVYISLAYFWIPLIFVLFIILLYHIKVVNQHHQEQEKLLIRQNKLATMGEMISLIAHQWRQPLSAINGVVLQLDIDYRKKLLNPEKINTYLDEIEKLTAYLSNTIHDFSSFFAINKEMNRFYIHDTITQAINLTSISNNKDIHIIFKKNTPIELKGIKSELIQSLLILLNNAIYACLTNLDNIKQGEIVIETHKLNNKVTITVADNGGGIAQKNLKNIFDPYFTTKKDSGGTGLGLYILKLIVEDSMNGKIVIKNGKEGAIFTIQIPNSL